MKKPGKNIPEYLQGLNLKQLKEEYDFESDAYMGILLHIEIQREKPNKKYITSYETLVGRLANKAHQIKIIDYLMTKEIQKLWTIEKTKK